MNRHPADMVCKGSARMWELGFELHDAVNFDKPLVYTKKFGKYTLIVAKRCGSTTMKWLGKAKQYECWTADELAECWPDNAVVVLRDPIQRYWSAIKRLLHVPQTTEVTAKRKGLIFVHCAPYLHHFKDKEFKIIPFEDLDQYFAEFHGRESVANDPLPEEEEWYPIKMDDMKDEYKTYVDIIKTHDKLPPQDIRSL